MLLSAFLFSGDEVDESHAPRYFDTVGMEFDGLEGTLRSRGEPAAERLDAPGDAADEINGAAKYEASRRREGSLECGGGECAELAEGTDGSRSKDT